MSGRRKLMSRWWSRVEPRGDERVRDRAQLLRQPELVVQLVEMIELVLDRPDDVGQLGREDRDLADERRDRDGQREDDHADRDREDEQDRQTARHASTGEPFDEGSSR